MASVLRPRGTITIGGATAKSVAVTTVADTGRGLAEALLSLARAVAFSSVRERLAATSTGRAAGFHL